MKCSFTIVFFACLVFGSFGRAQDGPALAAQARDVLMKNCFMCHGQDLKKLKGKLNLFDRGHLDDKERMIVVAQKPDESEMYKRILDDSMPPKSQPRLNDAEKKVIYQWIAAGGQPFPAGPAPVQPTQGPEQATERAAQVKEIFRAHCFECHGGSKKQAGITIFDHTLLLEKKKLMPGKADDSPLFQLITASDGSMMPPSGQPRLNQIEIDTVRRWINDGAPAFPADVVVPADLKKGPAAVKGGIGVEYVLQNILKHVRTVPLAERRYMRYFSINHILVAGATANELELHREALAKAINHLTWEPRLVRPAAIDGPLATVFVVDLRLLGWQYQPYDRWQGGKKLGKSSFNLFDLALLDYPYGILYEDSDTFDYVVNEFVVPSGMAAPVPYVRADWFVSTILLSPFYEDFLQLPHELKDLEFKLGIDSDANVRDYIAKRAGMAVSGVSRNNRVVERHPLKYGAYWKSFDFRTSKGLENIYRDPIYLHPTGGEMIFNLPNGLQAYYVANGKGVRLEEAPPEIVTDRFAPDKIVRNALSCIRCHDHGMKDFVDTMRPALLRLPGAPGFDKRFALQLYPEQKEMDGYLKEDRDRFESAMAKLLGRPLVREPLIPVSNRYLDDPLHLGTVTGELGLTEPGGLQELFRSPQFVGLGLMSLSAQGVVRRDGWDDYFAPVVRFAGLGTPVVPLDGIALREFPTIALQPYNITLKTNKKGNVFEVGDELVITVKNDSHKDVYLELIGTSARGRKVILTHEPVKVGVGQSYRYPSTGGIKIRGGIGKEQITLYASYNEFPGGELLRGEYVSDRVVHSYYAYSKTGNRHVRRFDAESMVKKTIDIETK